MQFRLIHLFAVTTWLAAVLALYRLHPIAVFLACPATFGPLGGLAVAKSIEGAIVGLVSAVFWCVLLSFVGGVVVFSSVFVLGAHGSLEHWPLWSFPTCFVYLTACSLIGGYVGGRIAIS